ncbi:MAG: hypothetical protein RLZZ312_613 [Bacteroidota bacterium]|jgi:single-strand DNA-binding protein
MNAMNNRVQLIGNVGNDPEIKNFDGGKKLAIVSLATKETYVDTKGEKIDNTSWHRVSAWGKTADIIEKYVVKGNKIAVEGKLTYKTYDDKNGVKQYQTEITISEVQLFGK